MTPRTSVSMTATTEEALVRRLVRDDGQEDICLATYRPSTGLSRFSALIRTVVPPGPGDRLVHGNATVTADYILRAAEVAQEDQCGLVLLHSHPGASRWQPMSGPDRDCEASYANLVREVTGLPLVGMTLATGNRTWSARHWDTRSRPGGGLHSLHERSDCRRQLSGVLERRCPNPRHNPGTARSERSVPGVNEPRPTSYEGMFWS